MDQQISFCTTSEGVRLAYTVFGSGPVLIAPPPWVSHLALERENPRIRSFWKKLASRHTVVRYDKHGCGLSDRQRNDFSLKKEVKDLESMIEHLRLAGFALFGFSQAGPIAIAYSAAHPGHVTRLILYGTFAQGTGIFQPWMKTYLYFLIQTTWGLGSSILSEIFIPDAGPSLRAFFMRFQRDAATGDMAVQLLKGADEWNVTALLPDIAIPTLVLHRKSDRVIPLSAGIAIAHLIPRSCLVILEGKNHFPMFGDSETILKAAHDFTGAEDILAAYHPYDYPKLINF